jgi:hypothetical protein
MEGHWRRKNKRRFVSNAKVGNKNAYFRYG